MAERLPVPPVDYTSKDWATFVDDMTNAIEKRLPEWTSRSPNDFGIIMLELFAYVGDALSFYGDRIANEAFLPTAVLRSSVLNLAKMLDYRPTGNISSIVELTMTSRVGGGTVVIPAGSQVSTPPVGSQPPVVFETDEQITILDVPPNQGLVWATQGKTVSNEVVGTSTGSPDQAFSLFLSPVVDESQAILVDEGAGPLAWVYYANLIDAGAADNAYSTETDENGVLNILFGDNVNGRIPANGATIYSTYRVGGGNVGNVGAETISVIVTPVSNWIAVFNEDVAEGGADAETLDQIRDNAPRSLTTIDRAVTTDDYAALAIKAGAAKAKAQASVYTNVNLYIAPPSGSEEPIADAGLKAKIQTYIDARKMINATVTLMDPVYVDINVSADIQVLPQYSQDTIKTDVEKAVKTVLSYENSDFGDRVTLSHIYRAINAVTGVDYAVVTLLSRTGSGLADVQLADNEIPSIGTVTITAAGGITT